MDLTRTHNTAVEIAEEAGQMLRQGLSNQKTISHKSSAIDLLTEYDQASHRLITGKLRQAFPDHQILSEEDEPGQAFFPNGASPYIWHIDPLDGTNNFAHEVPIFAVSIALYQGDQALISVVYDPMRDECFSAIRDQGAILRSAGKQIPIQVSNATRLIESLLVTGFPYDRQTSSDDNLAQTAAFLKRIQGIRRTGSAAIDLAYVAAGRFDGYWEFKINSWDVAAGVLLVQEAGGRVSDADGQPLRLKPSNSVIASNGHIHEAMLEVIASVAIQVQDHKLP